MAGSKTRNVLRYTSFQDDMSKYDLRDICNLTSYISSEWNPCGENERMVVLVVMAGCDLHTAPQSQSNSIVQGKPTE